jgi:hypothetical protein
LKLKIGQFVNYVILSGEIRPLLITQVYDNGLVDGVQFRNGSNDDRRDNAGGSDRGKVSIWRPSIKFDAQKRPGTYHFMEAA